jgi:glucose-6-phosphate 1-dehydrogenase
VAASSDAVVFHGAAHAVVGHGAVFEAKAPWVIVEKPFGTDLASSRALNETMHQVFAEDAIHRVDHWLGLEPLNNIAPAEYRFRAAQAAC